MKKNEKETLNNRVPIRIAAEELGCTTEYLRRLIKAGDVDLGFVVKNKHKCTYFVFRNKLDELLGIENKNMPDVI